MNTSFNNLNRLHDLARCRADALRRKAMDDFWRSAKRLAERLSCRAQGRSTRTSTLSSGV